MTPRVKDLEDCEYRRGEAHHRAKLTKEMVRFIRREYVKGKTTYQMVAMQLYDEFGIEITPVTVGQIVRRETWRHLEEEE